MAQRKLERTKNGLPTINYIRNRSVEEDGPMDTPCWIWQGAKTQWDYGMMSMMRDGRRQSHPAHRLAYEILNPDIFDNELEVAHNCHNPSCVNPTHLSQKTHQDNVNDGLQDGNWKNHGHRKLTREMVERIRSKPRNYSRFERLAAEFGVDLSTIYHVYSGRTWAWVAD